jgi:hypothetical protein
MMVDTSVASDSEMLVEDRSKHSKANKASRQEVFRSRYLFYL